MHDNFYACTLLCKINPNVPAALCGGGKTEAATTRWDAGWRDVLGGGRICNGRVAVGDRRVTGIIAAGWQATGHRSSSPQDKGYRNVECMEELSWVRDGVAEGNKIAFSTTKPQVGSADTVLLGQSKCS